MANVIVPIPDAIFTRLILGFTSQLGYSPTEEDGTPNDMTRLEFARRKLFQIMRENARAYELSVARRDAESQKASEFDGSIQSQ